MLNLEHICEVLYKLHPSVLDYLVGLQRRLGGILGFIDLNNPSMEEREFLANTSKEVDYTDKADKTLPMEDEDFNCKVEELKKNLIKELTKDSSSLTEEAEEEAEAELDLSTKKDQYNSHIFHELRKYIQLDTDEYIPIKIFVEVEDPVNGRKIKELVRALETTRAPEQFYWNKKEIDEHAYFAEGYGLRMNDEQKKKSDEFFYGEDVDGLKKILKKEKLYP